MSRLLAGVAQTVITPPVGVDLCGYAHRAGPSQGVHDDLFAKALYLSDGTTDLALVTADLIGLSADDVTAIRSLVQQEAGLSSEAVLVTCSHTHSGPATHCIKYLGDWDEAYLGVLVRTIAGVVVMAAKRTQPAVLGWQREAAQVHVNRRQRTPQGMTMGAEPTGVHLPWVDVLAVDTAEGRPLARWFCHAAHAVTLGSDNLLISADWPGYAQRALEGAEPGATALFAQGCCGNLNSHPRGTFEIAARQGWIIAGAVLKAAALAPKSSEVVLEYATRTIQLPLQDPPSVSEAEQLVRDMQQQREQAPPETLYQLRKTYAGYVRWAQELLELAQRGVRELTVPFEVQAVRIGPAVIVGLPGEVFAEYALNIAASSPATPTVVTAYTNGNVGYVPTAQAFTEGGYEVDAAYRFYSPTMLRPECESLILQTAQQLIQVLFC
jgi:neutral ceramidase